MGRNDLAGLVRYNPHMARYSDDGLTLSGAYGPPIMSQMAYVQRTLLEDPESRQAVLSIWQPNPVKSLDTPCTLNMTFQLRPAGGGVYLLHNHTTMRASDAWLGFPYDVFSFSMVAYALCCRLNHQWRGDGRWAQPGTLYLTMASSHLYASTVEDAQECVLEALTPQPLAPPVLYQNGAALYQGLEDMREARRGSRLRWWDAGVYWDVGTEGVIRYNGYTKGPEVREWLPEEYQPPPPVARCEQVYMTSAGAELRCRYVRHGTRVHSAFGDLGEEFTWETRCPAEVNAGGGQKFQCIWQENHPDDHRADDGEGTVYAW